MPAQVLGRPACTWVGHGEVQGSGERGPGGLLGGLAAGWGPGALPPSQATPWPGLERKGEERGGWRRGCEPGPDPCPSPGPPMASCLVPMPAPPLPPAAGYD